MRPFLEEYWNKYQIHHRQVADLAAKRDGNQKSHIDMAQTVIKVAETLIHTYRGANSSNRGKECPGPEFIKSPVTLDSLLEPGDFVLHPPANTY